MLCIWHFWNHLAQSGEKHLAKNVPLPIATATTDPWFKPQSTKNQSQFTDRYNVLSTVVPFLLVILVNKNMTLNSNNNNSDNNITITILSVNVQGTNIVRINLVHLQCLG